MRRFLATLGAAALVTSGVAVAMAADKDTAKTTVTGELVDTYCYSSGGASGEGHKDCAQKCAASGIPVAVLSDGKAITLAANPIPLAPYMAQTVRVTGEVNKDSGVIVPDKVEVKDGDNWKEVQLKDAHHPGAGERGEK